MYLCMCTPDLCFTSTEVLIRLQNKNTKIRSTKERLLFSSTNTCSGGLHGWGGHRHWATLTSSQHSSSKGNAGSRLNLQWVLAIAQNIDRARLFHPALHTCSWGAFLMGFWSTICLLLLLVTNDAVKEKKSWGLQCSPLLQLSPGWNLLAWAAWLRRQAGECRQLGHPKATLSSYLISATREGMLCLQSTAKATHQEYPQRKPWGTATPWAGQRARQPGRPDPDPAIPTASAGQKANVHSFLIIVTAWAAYGHPAPIHSHMKVTEVPLVLINRHLLQMFFIKSFPYILQKFLEGDSEGKPLPTTASGCLLATTSLTYTTTAIMRGILQYLTNNNPCSLNEICP